MPAPSYAYGVLVSVRDDNDPQPQSSDDALCRCTLALQNFVDATPINAVLLRPRCLASGFLDFAPKQLNNVLLLQDAHWCPRRLKLTVCAHAVGTTVIHKDGTDRGPRAIHSRAQTGLSANLYARIGFCTEQMAF